MRVNVYSQELTNEVQAIVQRSNTGKFYSAVRLMLRSSDHLHHTPDDDDRSAVTFWMPTSQARREAFAKVLEQMAETVRALPQVIRCDGNHGGIACEDPDCWMR